MDARRIPSVPLSSNDPPPQTTVADVVSHKSAPHREAHAPYAQPGAYSAGGNQPRHNNDDSSSDDDDEDSSEGCFPQEGEQERDNNPHPPVRNATNASPRNPPRVLSATLIHEEKTIDTKEMSPWSSSCCGSRLKSNKALVMWTMVVLFLLLVIAVVVPIVVLLNKNDTNDAAPSKSTSSKPANGSELDNDQYEYSTLWYLQWGFSGTDCTSFKQTVLPQLSLSCRPDSTGMEYLGKLHGSGHSVNCERGSSNNQMTCTPTLLNGTSFHSAMLVACATDTNSKEVKLTATLPQLEGLDCGTASSSKAQLVAGISMARVCYPGGHVGDWVNVLLRKVDPKPESCPNRTVVELQSAKNIEACVSHSDCVTTPCNLSTDPVELYRRIGDPACFLPKNLGTNEFDWNADSVLAVANDVLYLQNYDGKLESVSFDDSAPPPPPPPAPGPSSSPPPPPPPGPSSSPPPP